MAPRISFSRMFTPTAKPLPAKEPKGGPSGKEASELRNTSKGDPREAAKGKPETGEVKKERVTLRQLLDKERQEELEQAQKAKAHQPEVKEERKSAGSQSPESLRTSTPNPRVRTQLALDKQTPYLPTIPEKHEIEFYGLEKARISDGRTVYREVEPDFPVKPEGPPNKFGLSTIHEDSVLGPKLPEAEKRSNSFTQTFKSAMQGLSKTFSGLFTRSTP